MKLTRRTFLHMGAVATVSAVWIFQPWSAEAHAELLVTGHRNSQGEHFLSGFSAVDEELFRISMTEACHGFAVDRTRGRLVIAPLAPGRHATVVDLASGTVMQRIDAYGQGFFQGHLCYSHDGRYLYTTESRYQPDAHWIIRRDAETFRLLNAWDAHCVGPHEIALTASGILVVAGGGLIIDPDQGRDVLNRRTMQSHLVYLDAQSGALLSRHQLPTAGLSIRHLAVRGEQVGLICQYVGERDIPALVAVHSPEQAGGIRPLDVDDISLLAMKQYTASACFSGDGRLLGVTSPRSDLVTLWDTQQHKLLKRIVIEGARGIALSRDKRHFVITAGDGEIHTLHLANVEQKARKVANWPAAHWSNHLANIV